MPNTEQDEARSAYVRERTRSVEPQNRDDDPAVCWWCGRTTSKEWAEPRWSFGGVPAGWCCDGSEDGFYVTRCSDATYRDSVSGESPLNKWWGEIQIQPAATEYEPDPLKRHDLSERIKPPDDTFTGECPCGCGARWLFGYRTR